MQALVTQGIDALVQVEFANDKCVAKLLIRFFRTPAIPIVSIRYEIAGCVWRITDFPRISNSPHTGTISDDRDRTCWVHHLGWNSSRACRG
jgi:hypothetical protein